MRRTVVPALACALLLAVAAGPLRAGGSQGSSQTTPQCSRSNPSECINGVTASFTSGDTLRATATRISEGTRRGEPAKDEMVGIEPGGWRLRGLAAGGAIGGWGVWASYGRTRLEGDDPVLAFDSDLDNGLLGADLLFGDRLVVGIAGGIEALDTTTPANGGEQDTDGYLLAPYAVFQINDFLSLDLSGGYASTSSDQQRIDPANGAILRSSFDADRLFFATNLNAFYPMGRWILSARIGYLTTDEDQETYRETGGPSARNVGERNLNLSQLAVGGEVGYRFGAAEPFLSLTYRNDLARRDDGGPGGPGGPGAGLGSTSIDDDDFQLGFGVRYFRSRFSASALLLNTFGRDDIDELSISVGVRADF